MIRIMLISHVTRPEEVNDPLGIEVLSGMIQAYFPGCAETRLFFINGRKEQWDLKKTMDTYRPHLVGISSKITQADQMLDTYLHARGLNDPKPVVLIGDHLSTLASTEVLNIAPEAVCVRGEGEDALRKVVELLVDIDDSLSFDALSREILDRDIPNCVLLRDGVIHTTSGRMVDISNATPPDRTFIHQAIADGWIVHAEASRGCPWSLCSFCYINQKYHGLQPWRAMPIESVVSDLEFLSTAGADTVWFTDEDFVGPDLDRIWKLGEAIIESKVAGRIHPQMAFFVSSGVKTILGHDKALESSGGAPKLLSHLRKAGIQELFLGVESGCNTQLQRFRKGLTDKNNIKAINLIRASGMDLDLGFIPFDPWTTLDELIENLDFLRRANLIYQPVRLMKSILITPGSLLANRYTKEHPETCVRLDDLTLDYEVRDERVALIADLVKRRWVRQSSTIYKLQTSKRVVLTEGHPERDTAMKKLCTARAAEYDFVNRCAKAAKEHPDRWYDAVMEIAKMFPLFPPELIETNLEPDTVKAVANSYNIELDKNQTICKATTAAG